MQAHGRLGAALGTDLVLEAVVPCLGTDGKPSADPAILRRDMAAVRDAAAGIAFTRVAVSPADRSPVSITRSAISLKSRSRHSRCSETATERR